MFIQKLICHIDNPIVLGNIRRPTVLTNWLCTPSVNVYLPEYFINLGICIAKWKNAPVNTPYANPYTPHFGVSSMAPAVMPALYSIGAKAGLRKC